MAQPEPPPPAERARQIKYQLALGLCVACPVLILLPPRKLDWYSFGLATTLIYSGNHVFREKTGRNVFDFSAKHTLPTDRAKEVHKMLGSREPEKSAMEKIWMGDEKPDWKKRRDEEEREALEDGRGYSGLIMDQLKEVWTWKTAAEREKEADELEAKQDAEEAQRLAAEKRS